jgi:ABC-type uncharacterized transport system YnjBCD permease subunit
MKAIIKLVHLFLFLPIMSLPIGNLTLTLSADFRVTKWIVHDHLIYRSN